MPSFYESMGSLDVLLLVVENMRGKGNEMEGDDFAINFPLTGLLPDAT